MLQAPKNLQWLLIGRSVQLQPATLILEIRRSTLLEMLENVLEVKNLPKNHPAQKLKSQWQAMSIEETIPMLALYHG